MIAADRPWWLNLGLDVLAGPDGEAELDLEPGERHAPAMTLSAFRARYAADFNGFCDLLEVLPKDVAEGGPVPFVLTPIQRRYNASRTARDIVLKARQVKITTLEQARDIWFWLTRRGAAVRIVVQSATGSGPKNDRSKSIAIMLMALKKAGLELLLAAESVGRWLLPPEEGGAVLEIVEAGASEKAAAKKGRGGTTQRLHVTELAFFEYAGATLKGIKQSVPSAASGSEIVYESTPNGMGAENEISEGSRDESGGAMFYRTWTQAERGLGEFKPHFFPWYENPENQTPLDEDEVIDPRDQPDEKRRAREEQIVRLGCTQEQLKWYRAQVVAEGQDDTDQEYPTDPKSCFLSSGRKFFDEVRTTTLMAAARKPIEVRLIRRPGADGFVFIWQRPKKETRYVAGCDTSEGTGQDRGGGQFWEVSTGVHVATVVGQFKPAELATILAEVGVEYNYAILAVERNNHGHATLAELLRSDPESKKRRYPRVFHDRDQKPGWLSTEVTRTPALDALEQAHRAGTWSTPDAEVLDEMRTFIISKRGRPEARGGCRDDLVIMAAISHDVLTRTGKNTGTQGPAPPVRTADPDRASLLGGT